MTAVLAYRLRLATAIALAAGTLVAAVLLAIPVSFPSGAFAGPLPPAAVSEARAERALAANPSRMAEATAATRATLSQRPMDAVAWSRLAWIASRNGDRRAMLEALDRSYAVAPYGPEVTGWRLRFAYGHWGALTPDLRRQVSSELVQAVHDRPAVVEAARPDIVDPAGRLAFELTRTGAAAQ